MTLEMNSSRLTVQMLKSLGLSVVLAGSVVAGASVAQAAAIDITSDPLIDGLKNSVTYAGGFSTSTNTSLTMTNGGLMMLSDTVASTATGNITISGSGKTRSGIIGVDANNSNAPDTNNGKLSIGNPQSTNTVTLTAGGYIAVNTLELNGGTINVSGKLSENPNADTIPAWALGSQLYAKTKITVDTDATVNLSDGGMMEVAAGTGSMDIKGTSTVNVKKDGLILTNETTLTTAESGSLIVEKDGVVRGQKWDVTDPAKPIWSGAGTMNITDTSTVTVQTGGLIDMGKGTVTVNGGTLNVDQAIMHTRDDSTKYVLPSGVNQTTGLVTGDLTITSGTVNVANNAYISGMTLLMDGAGTLNIGGDLHATLGRLSMGHIGANANIAGTYYFGTESNVGTPGAATSGAGNGTLTVGAISLKNLQDVAANDIKIDSGSNSGLDIIITGLDSKTPASFFNGTQIDVSTNGLLQLGNGSVKTYGGTYAGTMKMSGTGNTRGAWAELEVNGGTWTLAKLELSTVKDQNLLNVDNGRLNVTSITGSGDATASVGSLGKLQVKYSDVYNDSTALATKLGTVAVDGGGELILTGKDKISLADYKKVITAMMPNGSHDMGTLTLQGTELDIVAGDYVTGTTNLDDGKLVNGMNVGTTNKVQTTASAAAGTGVKGVTSGGLVITGTTENTPLNIKIDSGTLGLSANGGSFITTDKTGVKTNVTVDTGKTLALNGAGSLNGKVTLDVGNLNVQGAGGTKVEEILATNGSIAVGSSAALETGKLTLGTTGNALLLNGGGTVKAGELTAVAGSELVIGDERSRGSLVANKVSLDGAQMFLDPAWRDGVALEGASNATLKFNQDATTKKDAMNGLVTVGQNSWVSLGTDNQTWFTDTFAAQSKLSWSKNGITAALAVYAPQLLVESKGGLLVDGSIDEAAYNDGTGTGAGTIATAGDLTLGHNSLLVVNAAGLGDKAALTSGKTAGGAASIAQKGTDGEKAAQLLIVDASTGSKVKILENFTGASDTNTFKADTISFNNFLLKTKGDAIWKDNNLTVEADFNTVAYDALRTAGLSHNAGQLVINYTNRGNFAANQFMENALSTQYHGTSAPSMATALESGLDTARAVDVMGAGLATVSANSASTMARAMGQNVNGVAAGSAMGGMTIGLWGMPVYSAEKLDKGNIDDTGLRVKADTDMFGGIIGADLTFGADQNFRVGAAFNVGAGETTSKALNVSSKNEFDYVGGALYAATMFDKFTVAGIVGYTSISNDIKQDQLGGQLTSKPDSDLWNLGVEASYTFNVAGWNLVPSLGVEWLHYSQDSYTTMLNNSAVVNVASASANRVNLPIGIKLNKVYPFGTGNFIPEVRARVIPAFGDEMNTNVSLPGIPNASASLNGINQDNLTGEVGMGLTVNLTPSFSFAAGYDFQFSKSRSAHNVNAMLRLKF